MTQAIDLAGSPEAFWKVLARALTVMPEYWRSVYPQGRSGADCAAALFCCDQTNADLGPDTWHVFCWGGPALTRTGAASQPSVRYREI